jgi:hypothetical protein
MDGVAVKPLTVGFHETPFLTKLNQENQFGFWFQLSDEERQQAGSPWGPNNPQALNRYSYVLNNPLKYTDPTGHSPAALLLLPLVTIPVAPVLIVGGIIIGAATVAYAATHGEQLFGSNIYEAKGEYVPPGLSGKERQKYRAAVHRYKKTWGLRANQDVPKDILDQMADAIQNGESADDAADMADSPPEED